MVISKPMFLNVVIIQFGLVTNTFKFSINSYLFDTYNVKMLTVFFFSTV